MSANPIKAQRRIDELVTMRTLLHPKDLAIESELMMTKWFEYRFLSPLAATQLFAIKYRECLRRHVRKNLDVDLSTRVSGVSEKLPVERAGWFTQLWHARQRADRLMVPYDVLLEFAFDFAFARKRKWVPLPNQLFSTETNGEAWHGKFPDFIEDYLPLYISALALPQYRLEHDRQLPAQRDFRAFMLDEFKGSTKSYFDRIGKLVHAERYLAQDDCLALLPTDDHPEILDRVRSEDAAGRWEHPPRLELDDEDFFLSCFGVRESLNVEADPCRRCPLLRQCSATADCVDATTTLKSGSTSPVAEKDKERNRRNVANSRARKASKARGLAAGSLSEAVF
jgi:hypothetical protein